MKEEVFNQYVDRVVDLFKITREDFFKKSRKRDLVEARYLVFYLCIERSIKIVSIQEFMIKNGYNLFHNHIIYGVKAMQEKVDSDRDYQSIVKDIEKSVFI